MKTEKLKSSLTEYSWIVADQNRIIEIATDLLNGDISKEEAAFRLMQYADRKAERLMVLSDDANSAMMEGTKAASISQ